MNPDPVSINIQTRLLHLERMYDVMKIDSVECKAALHKISSKFDVEVQNINQSFASTEAQISKIRDLLLGHHQKYDIKIIEQSNKINELSESNSKIYLMFNEVLSDIKDLKNLYNQLADKISDLTRSEDAFDRFSVETAKEINRLSLAIENLSQKQKEMYAVEQSQFKNQARVCMDFQDHKKDFDALRDVVMVLSKMLETHKTETQSLIHGNMTAMHSVVDTKIASIDIPKHQKVYDPNQEILEELRGLRLDVQNAVLKNKNLEAQYKLQEKKVENISLNVQKLQLGN